MRNSEIKNMDSVELLNVLQEVFDNEVILTHILKWMPENSIKECLLDMAIDYDLVEED